MCFKDMQSVKIRSVNHRVCWSTHLVILIGILYVLRYKANALHSLQDFRGELFREDILGIWTEQWNRRDNVNNNHTIVETPSE